MSSTLLCRLLAILGAIALSSGMPGCSFSITSEEVETPSKISTVAIGSIEAADPERQRIARRFRRALAAGLEDSEAFSQVMLPAPPQLPEDAVLVTGRFLEVNDGSEALRFLVGYGIGSPTLRARFEISDPAGRVLASFEEDARSFDGAGYAAHWNPVGTDELADDFRDRDRRSHRALEPRRRAGSLDLVTCRQRRHLHGTSPPERSRMPHCLNEVACRIDENPRTARPRADCSVDAPCAGS